MKIFSILMLIEPLVFLELLGFAILSLSRYGSSAKERALLAPFVSIAIILVVSGNLLHLDLTMRSISLSIDALFVVVCVGLLLKRKKERTQRLNDAPSSLGWILPLLLALAIVMLVNDFPYVAVGSEQFVGYGTRDAWNYTMQAQFFLDYPFSTILSSGNQQPYLPLAVWLKNDRVGASVLQAWIASLFGTGAKQAWGAVSLLGPTLLVPVLWIIAEELELGKLIKLFAVVFGATLPGLAWVYLDNTLLAHAVSLPLILLYPYLLSKLVEKPSVVLILMTSGVFFSFLYIYGDMILILVALSIIIAFIQILIDPRRWYRHIILIASAVLIGAISVPSFAPMLYSFYIKAFSVFPNPFPPDGLTFTAFTRVFLGSYISNHGTNILFIGTALSVFSALIGSSGILNGFFTMRTALSASLLALICLPLILLSKPEPLTYQYYKTLVSISPILPLGVGFVLTKLRKDGSLVSFVILMGTYCILIAGLLFSLLGTIDGGIRYLAVHHTYKFPNFIYWSKRLEGTHGQNILIDVDDDNEASWLAYHARYDNVWMKKEFYGAGWNAVLDNKKMGYLDLETLPTSSLTVIKFNK